MNPREPTSANATRDRREFGTWPSPVSAGDLAAAAISCSLPKIDGRDVLWSERRPAEGARVAIVRRTPDGSVGDVISAPFSARGKVHEYGGGHFAAHAGRVCFVNEADQDLYLAGEGAPARLTDEPAARFGDMAFDPVAARLYTVAERHHAAPAPPRNTIAAVPLDGPARGEVHDILAGRDFYAYPRPSPDGRQIAWLAWDLPSMPWEAAELWVGALGEAGSVSDARRVAGGRDDAVFQPEWGPGGALYFVADRDGLGNIHVWRDGEVRLVARADADVSRPLWGLGASAYAVLEPGRLIAAAWRAGACEIAIADEGAGTWTALTGEVARVDDLVAGPEVIALNGGGEGAPARVHLISRAAMDFAPLADDRTGLLKAGDISHARVLTFPVDGEPVHALYYPPSSARFAGPEGALPPLVVSAHGGPTAMARRGFALDRQYWTTRGFAFLDVDYRGSTGYGGAYRKALDGLWGERDAIDTVAAARHAAGAGLCDPARMVIRGSSAGGLTVLNALIGSDVFAAGASYYGVTDLRRLAADTHKFESGYLDSLLGGGPEEFPDIYDTRSPVNHAQSITAPVIFFQGLDDAVVPPAQSRAMAATLRERGVPVAMFEFAGEGHGFRKPETVITALEAELAFYARILGIAPAEKLPAIEIDNL